MRIKYLFFTSSRADLGLLANLYLRLQKTKNIETHLAINGSHLSKELGYTFSEIKNLKIMNYHKLKYKYKLLIENDPNKVFSSVVLDMNKLIHKLDPDFLVVVGDRYETLAATLSGYLNKKKIIHFHGGEKTVGSFDDSIRHAITKLASYHFVAEKEYLKRVIQLGEDKSNIFLVGNLIGYGLQNKKYYSKIEIEKKLNIKFNKFNLLITVHPETAEKEDFNGKVEILLDALASLNENYNLYFTAANSDPGSASINKLILKFIGTSKNRFYFKSLGQLMYLSMMRQCDIVVGNSSSAIIEAPYFNVPSLNLGERQKGRVFKDTIIQSAFNKTEILTRINVILKKNLKHRVIKTNTKYDIDKLISLMNKLHQKPAIKNFVDLI